MRSLEPGEGPDYFSLDSIPLSRRGPLFEALHSMGLDERNVMADDVTLRSVRVARLDAEGKPVRDYNGVIADTFEMDDEQAGRWRAALKEAVTRYDPSQEDR